MTPERPARPAAPVRVLQVVGAGTSLALLSALVLGAAAGEEQTAPAAGAGAGHHGTVLTTAGRPEPDGTAAPADDEPEATPDVALAPGTKIGADGRVVHDHGDLEVTVMLATEGGTEVLGPVRPGASMSFVNHTTADQVLTTDDGSLRVEVPLVQLVTLAAPDAPGTYRLVSRTDRTVTAEVVVTAEAAAAAPDLAGAAVVTTAGEDGRPDALR